MQYLAAEEEIKDAIVPEHYAVSFSIKIDRVLDYNLLLYFEYQTQDKQLLEGEVLGRVVATTKQNPKETLLA